MELLRRTFFILFIILSVVSASRVFLYDGETAMRDTLAILEKDGGAEGILYKAVWNQSDQLLFYISKLRLSVLVEADLLTQDIYAKVSRGVAVRLKGTFSLPQESWNPGGFNQRRYLLSKNVKLTAYIEKDEDITILKEKPCSLSALGAGVRFEINTILSRFLSEAPKHFVLGIMTGDTTEMSANEKNWIRRSGISHLMAVSGTHVVYILLPFRRMVKRTRFSIAMRSVVCILPLSFFMIIAGMTPSVLRAGITCLCAFAGKILERRDDALNSLGFAGCIGLLYNPYAVADISFQLSYGAAFAMLLAVPRFKQLFLRRENKIVEIFLTGLAINITLLPLLAYHFNMVSVIGLLFNLIAAPISAVLCLLGYFLCFLFSLPFLHFLAVPLSLVLTGLASALIKAAEFGASLPAPIGYLLVVSPSAGFFIVYYVVLGIFLLPKKIQRYLFDGLKYLLHRKKCIAVFSFVVVLSFLIMMRKRDLEILYFDVGQGSSALVRSSDGICGLFDGGNGYIDVSTLLYKNGVGGIDFIVLSHGDQDHAGGLQKIFTEHNVGILLVPDNSDDPGIAETVAVATEAGCRIITVSNHCNLDFSEGLKMQIYFERDQKSFNNSSLVVQLVTTNANVVFPGDLEYSGEEQLLQYGFPEKCDLLTIAHHGSDTGTGKALLERLRPEYAVISVGRNNRYGHPSEEVLNRLSEAGIATYRTDLQGAVRVTFFGRSMAEIWSGREERIVEVRPWRNRKI